LIGSIDSLVVVVIEEATEEDFLVFLIFSEDLMK
jgi:hypothetical protein